MYLELTDEQQFLSEAATDALGRQDSLATAREALDGADPLELWPVAVEAGWPGLLSGEDVDGTGLGAYEALLVLEACGARLADAHLLGHLPAVALIEAGLTQDSELRGALASGEKRAALVDLSLSTPAARLTAANDRLSGTVPFVIDAPGADVLVVLVEQRAYLVDASAGELTVTTQVAYDATRSLGTVVLDGAPGRELVTSGVGLGADLQRALLGAESVGAAQAALTMARDYAIDRHAFGRAIGSYQSLKHRMVEMLRKVENGRSLMVAAGRAWNNLDGGPTSAGHVGRLRHPRSFGFGLAANALRTVGADALDFSAPENIFIHGGIGATWEHDAQLYYRRAEVSRRLAGGAEAAARSVADALIAAV